MHNKCGCLHAPHYSDLNLGFNVQHMFTCKYRIHKMTRHVVPGHLSSQSGALETFVQQQHMTYIKKPISNPILFMEQFI